MSNASFKATLKEISLKAEDCRILKSFNFGDIEVWNIVTCWLQNAEVDNCDVLSYVQCVLCDESESVCEFARELGVKW